jgi:hypothetical protein
MIRLNSEILYGINVYRPASLSYQLAVIYSDLLILCVPEQYPVVSGKLSYEWLEKTLLKSKLNRRCPPIDYHFLLFDKNNLTNQDGFWTSNSLGCGKAWLNSVNWLAKAGDIFSWQEVS